MNISLASVHILLKEISYSAMKLNTSNLYFSLQIQDFRKGLGAPKTFAPSTIFLKFYESPGQHNKNTRNTNANVQATNTVPSKIGSVHDSVHTYLSSEKKPGWFAVHKGLYYPVIWGL